MTTIKKETRVPYTTDQMFALVMAVDQYSAFLPWCKDADIQNKTPHSISAYVEGYKMGIPFVFTMIYQIQADKSIVLRLMNNGPFQHIQGLWKFSPENEGSRFSFELQFEFKNKFLAWTLTPIIRSEIDSLIKEFCKQAETIYG